MTNESTRELPEGWFEPKDQSECAALERELQKEIGSAHQLSGRHGRLIARRYDCDEALYELDDGRIAQVHLTWANHPESDPHWPRCHVFGNFDTWHQSWISCTEANADVRETPLVVPRYLLLTPGQSLPSLDCTGPSKAVLIIEAQVTTEWQKTVSGWLVSSGCRFVMAWGQRCAAWDDTVDDASLRAFDYGPVPDDQMVMTTWHEDVDMEDVFWFAVHSAKHPTLALNETLVVHIAESERRAELLQKFKDGVES